jgi:hypothetical protein
LTPLKVERKRLSADQGTSVTTAPPSAQNTTTSNGGVFHMNSSGNAATPSAKSPALLIPDGQQGAYQAALTLSRLNWSSRAAGTQQKRPWCYHGA